MARRTSKGGRQAALDDLRVQLIPVPKDNFDIESRRNVVQQLIGLMVLNLHKRGRPKKNNEGDLSHAI